MSIYREIEDEFLIAVKGVKIGSSADFAEQAMNAILDRKEGITNDQKINVRLYFNTRGTLEGLSNWARS